MNMISLNLLANERQIANLRKLLTHVRKLLADPSQRRHSFDMTNFMSFEGDPCDYPSLAPDEYTECGTSACLAGHAVDAGIKPRPDDDWQKYVARELAHHEILYHWLFSGAWVGVDNSLEGAAIRLEYALELGVPNLPPFFSGKVVNQIYTIPTCDEQGYPV